MTHDEAVTREQDAADARVVREHNERRVDLSKPVPNFAAGLFNLMVDINQSRVDALRMERKS